MFLSIETAQISVGIFQDFGLQLSRNEPKLINVTNTMVCTCTRDFDRRQALLKRKYLFVLYCRFVFNHITPKAVLCYCNVETFKTIKLPIFTTKFFQARIWSTFHLLNTANFHLSCAYKWFYRTSKTNFGVSFKVFSCKGL